MMSVDVDKSLLELVRQHAARIEARHPNVRVAVYDATERPGGGYGDGSAAQVYMTARVLTDCTRCGEPLDPGAPGPYTWHVQGEANGSYSFQHGCGQWNPPVEVGTEIGEGTDPDGALMALLAELDGQVTEMQDREVESVRQDLADSIMDACDALATGADEDDVLTGSETEPGVFRDRDSLVAWDWDPTGRDPEGVTMRVHWPVGR